MSEERKPADPAVTTPAPPVSGEGNYEASRRYRHAVEAFARSGKVEAAARDAADVAPGEAKALEQAETEGKSRAAEEDPKLRDGSAD